MNTGVLGRAVRAASVELVLVKQASDIQEEQQCNYIYHWGIRLSIIIVDGGGLGLSRIVQGECLDLPLVLLFYPPTHTDVFVTVVIAPGIGIGPPLYI